MRKSKFSEAQILAILKDAEAGCGPSRSCRGLHPPACLLMRCLLDGEAYGRG